MKIALNDRKLFVCLGSKIDSERFCQLSTNAKIQELRKPNENIYFQITSLVEAIDLCKNFIRYYDLGNSNWTGGRIVDSNNNFVANISYNGRLWDNEDWKFANEILC